MAERAPPPCAPAAQRSVPSALTTNERLFKVEYEIDHMWRRIDHLGEQIAEMNQTMKGTFSSWSHDIQMTLSELKAIQTRQDVLLRGERGDDGVLAVVSEIHKTQQQILKDRESVSNKEWALILALILGIGGLILDKVFG